MTLTKTSLVVLSAALALGGGPGQPSAWNFDADPAGRPPSGFTFAAMRQPAPGAFIVRREGGSGHLVHAAEPHAKGFSFAMAPVEPLGDMTISARLRLAGGGRAGGVVWRYVDARNYYAAVLDLARAELSMYRVVNGNMIKIEEEDGLELDVDAWHVLKIAHADGEVRVSLGGIRVFSDNERRHSRLLPEGRAGLLATGESEVWFDDLTIAPERGRR